MLIAESIGAFQIQDICRRMSIVPFVLSSATRCVLRLPSRRLHGILLILTERNENPMRRTSNTFTSVGLIVILFALGCHNTTPVAVTPSLRDTKWQLAASIDATLDPAKFAITADFDETNMSGRSAVNRYGGPYAVSSDGSFKIGALQSTRMAGPEDAMRAESTYFELLGRARRYSVTGANLTLTDEGSQTILTFTAR